ncbi:MAG: hypothetical protein ACXWXR_03085 [Candidatus Limnocylindrales bacterium]
MRIRVRAIKPSIPVDDASGWAIVNGTGSPGPGDEPVIQEAPVARGSIDWGPNEADVQHLLERAGKASDAERRRLAEAASWRWWPVTLPLGGSSSGARTLAILRARGAGRFGAVIAIEASAREAFGEREASRRPLAVRAVGNAALAVLVRDLIPDEAFDALIGPWREVAHQ